MNKNLQKIILCLLLVLFGISANAQERRPIDSEHPLWLIHVDVWNKADPQKIINLIPENIRPYVCMNLSLSCQYDTEKNVYKMPQNAIRTYKSWATVCQANGMWFTCQPASGGHTHIQDDDIETFEYFYKRFPNFLGWNYAEQFWGFDEQGDKSSSSQASRIALFAKLVPMAHKYGGFLTISFCGNIWSHPLNPVGMMKRNPELLQACRDYPEAILWLYKYTTSSCFYNNESVTFSPFISGLAKSYGVRYDNCGWNGALDALLGEGHGRKYPIAAGIGTVMEQTCVNGGAVWDGPELIWTEDFQNLNNTNVSGYTRRNWGTFPGFRNAWLDMFDKILDGTMYIPTREEVVGKTKIVVVNNLTSGSDEDKYAAWGDLYDGLYKVTDPFNRNNGQWMDNFSYFKSTGRYGAIPVAVELYDSLAQTIPVKVNKSTRSTRWNTQTVKTNEFNRNYPQVSKGDMYVNRYRNQLVTYTPYSYLNTKTTSKAQLPLLYNTCDSLYLTWGLLSSGIVHEYDNHIDFYLNNYRTDISNQTADIITITKASAEPTYTLTKRVEAQASASASWDAATGTYTLTVTHKGPVDVSISCSGNMTEGKLTDVVPSSALSLPKQPADYNGEIIIEAEDMDYKNIKSCVTDPYGWYPSVRGHAGNGFMDMGTDKAGSLRHVVNIKHPGKYRIDVRYNNTGSDAILTLSINNGSAKRASIKKCQANYWKKASVEANFVNGSNTVIINNINGINMYIDQVIYTPVDCPAEKFGINIRPAENGSAVANTLIDDVLTPIDSATNLTRVYLTPLPNPGFAFEGWTIVHGDLTFYEDGSFLMPDDNVTVIPNFKDTTTIYEMDLTNVLNGAIPTGWRVDQSDAVHEYPNTYSSGSRTMGGFTGYQGKALYWRENVAEYGRQSNYKLHLVPGKYKLTTVMAAWKSTPKYSVRILTGSGNTLKQVTGVAATPNVNGSTTASIASAKKHELVFTVTAEADYIISYKNDDAVGGLDEFLLAACKVNIVPEESSIDQLDTEDSSSVPFEVYDLEGRRVPVESVKGIVVRNGKIIMKK